MIERDYSAEAKEFYGASYNRASSPSKLNEAFKWLSKSVVFEEAGDMVKVNMAFNQAVKKEGEAFA